MSDPLWHNEPNPIKPIESLSSMFHRHAREDREQGIAFGGQVAGLLFAATLPGAQEEALVRLAIWYLREALRCAESSLRAEEAAREAAQELTGMPRQSVPLWVRP